jgi:protein-tyrosine phosphatase
MSSDRAPMARILFVCMGNICRSPTAEGVFRHLLEQRGLSGQVTTDSAGTHDYHVGRPPDRRAAAAAAARGIDIADLRARQVEQSDFARFDWVLAMDEANLAELIALCPPEYRHKVRLFLGYARRSAQREVPDPYYGGAAGFEHVLDLVEDAAEGLLEAILAPEPTGG